MNYHSHVRILTTNFTLHWPYYLYLQILGPTGHAGSLEFTKIVIRLIKSGPRTKFGDVTRGQLIPSFAAAISSKLHVIATVQEVSRGNVQVEIQATGVAQI